METTLVCVLERLRSMIKNKIWEIGVGHLGVCFSALYWDNPEYDITMFEPHPRYYKEILDAAGNRSNVKIYNVAIGDFDGRVNFFDSETSSYVDGTKSVIYQQDKNGVFGLDNHPKRELNLKKIEVDIRKLSNYDNGTIDYLRIDTEGHEWFALKHLISRPHTINVETHEFDALYINPYLYEIEEWMDTNGYKKISMNHNDSIYRKI